MKKGILSPKKLLVGLNAPRKANERLDFFCPKKFIFVFFHSGCNKKMNTLNQPWHQNTKYTGNQPNSLEQTLVPHASLLEKDIGTQNSVSRINLVHKFPELTDSLH